MKLVMATDPESAKRIATSPMRRIFSVRSLGENPWIRDE